MFNNNPEVTPHDAATRAEGTLLIDVREPDEWTAGHAPGAIHIPLGTLTATAVSVGVSVMCICRTGGRSSKATAILRKGGVNAANVTGVMTAWAEADLPVVRDDATFGIVA